MTRNLPNQGNTSIVLTPSNMHAAFDPDGQTVWCTFAQQEARTNDGFCQFCGKTDHQTVEDFQADLRDLAEDTREPEPYDSIEDEVAFADESDYIDA